MAVLFCALLRAIAAGGGGGAAAPSADFSDANNSQYLIVSVGGL